MSTIVADPVDTLGDLLERLGDISPDRVLMRPQPGTAIEEDLLRLPHEVGKCCELVDGTLVMKVSNARDSALTFALGGFLFPYLGRHNIAVVLGPDGHTRYFGNQIRMPDVAVILRSRLPRGKLPKRPICPVPPDLAIEVLSPGNTRKEIARKLRTYFESGVKLVWVVDPRKRTVRVHKSPDKYTRLGEDDTLDGGEILPGFTVSIREWLDAAE